MSVQATTNLCVEVTCDACECKYHYELPVTGQAMFRDSSALRDLQSNIEQRVREGNLPSPDAPYYKACPECDYIPDWMARSAARRKARQRAAALFAIPILLTMALGVVGQFLGMLGAVLAGICMATALIGAPLALLLTPDSAARQIEGIRARWRSQHPQPGRAHQPQVQVVSP